MLRTAGLVILITQGALGQEFEVASIKQVPAQTRPGDLIEHGSGGPGTDDPGMFRCGNCFLLPLIEKAFDLKRNQFADPQPWMMKSEFQIQAKVRAGATQQQFLVMLQNLLRDRFKLSYHFEKRQVEGLALVVAKGGARLKESTAGEQFRHLQPNSEKNEKAVMGKDGYPVLDHPGRVYSNGRIRVRIDHQSMKDIERWVGNDYTLPVQDLTGLKGVYDINLFYVANPAGAAAPLSSIRAGPDGLAAPDGDPGPSFLEAIQSQLGLKLEPRKVMVDVFVIDHIEKIPISN
jgi:uncharacterized protein (TIGR03435 family)